MGRVLITGAAQGIGRAAAVAFASAGWQVGAFDVDEVAPFDPAHRANVVVGRLDVRDPAGWQAALEAFCGPDGALGALVNNAGVQRSGPFVDLPLDAQLALVDVNVKGTLIGCHAAFPYLARARGVVVNLASASAIYGQRDLAVYSATKFAVRGLTEALDLEWEGSGVRVRAVWPLFVRTAMTRDMDIGTTRVLGVRLTADDVAREILRVVDHPARWSVHRGVGRQSRLSMLGAAVGPSWLLRQVNRWLGRR